MSRTRGLEGSAIRTAYWSLLRIGRLQAGGSKKLRPKQLGRRLLFPLLPSSPLDIEERDKPQPRRLSALFRCLLLARLRLAPDGVPDFPVPSDEGDAGCELHGLRQHPAAAAS